MQINVNGQEYTSWADVPADVRAALAKKLPDADGNGVPDLFEGGGLPTGAGVVSSTAITVDGQSYNSLAALPPGIRSLLEGALPGLMPGVAPGGAPPTTAQSSAAPSVPPPVAAALAPPLAEGEVMLNGVPTRIGAEPKRKHWWQRG